ncbi:MAG: two-component regulator propeller domain-containing protein [Acidobacteriota bacterium]
MLLRIYPAIWLLLISLSFFSTISAQDNVPAGLNFHRWGSITVFNGLPSDSVHAIAQTPDGVLWFGTDNGLARFDGRRIQTFTFGSSDANRILVLKISPAGLFLVGTQRGAFIFAKDQFQPLAGTENYAITAIDNADQMLLGTDSGIVLSVTNENDGVNAQPLTTNPIVNTDGTPLFITGLVRDGERVLVATFGRGVMVLKDGRVTELPGSPRPLFVRSLACNKAGDIWLGTDAAKSASGIYLIKNDYRVTRVEAPSARVLALEATDNAVWAGSERYGLFRIGDAKLAESITFENSLGGLRSNSIYSIFTDREGVVWIGTNRGVSRYDPVGPLQQQVSDSPNGNFIRTLAASYDGKTIFAGSNRGLFYLSGSNWQPIDGFDGAIVHAIGNGLAGTSSGSFSFKDSTASKGDRVADGDTRSFAEFRGNTYAAVFGRGVVDISANDQNLVFPDETVTTLLTAADRLWIGTAGHGLFSFDGNSVKPEATSDVLKTGTIWHIFENADHGIWLAGQHGVFIYKDGQAQQVIACEDARDVYINGPDVWAATTITISAGSFRLLALSRACRPKKPFRSCRFGMKC